MALLMVPPPDDTPWPSLGRGVCQLIEDRAIYGPGSLQGKPYVIDPEFRAFIYRAYEIYPKGHPWAGRRRFKRVAWSVRKGLAKTEKQALIAMAELHPEGPTRFDGWDAYGNPVGRPVRSPYIPMLAVSVEQVEELAYGALKYILENGPDAELFDIGTERIIRLDEYGREDGKAVPLSNSPGARDGARTTLNCFDEPHRLILQRQRHAHDTMSANLPKRPLDDPWSLYVGTAGEPGEESVMEKVHTEGEHIRDGLIERADLFYLYRWADGNYDMNDKSERIEAIAEATGPTGEWGPGQFDDIASQWDVPEANHAFLERVWLNRWIRSGAQAFSPARWDELGTPGVIEPRATVVAGFDGSRFLDATAIVLTEVATGKQMLWGIWERPLDLPEHTGDGDNEAAAWEVPHDEVEASVQEMMKRFNVIKFYADPPHWKETVGKWAGSWPDVVEEWWTNRRVKMAEAVRAFQEAIKAGEVSWSLEDVNGPDFCRHIGNAGSKKTNLYDVDGNRLVLLTKIHPLRKFDAAMAATISWQAYLDAVKGGAKVSRRRGGFKRLR